LFMYAFDLCMLREDGTTGFILTQNMAETINCSYESTKVSLKRLISKGLISRMKGKTSRGGFIILSIPRQVKTLVLQLKIGNKSGNDIENELDTGEIHYSSSNITTTTTIGEDECEKIDVSPLGHIGLTKKHLSHLKDCSVELIQDSINHFSWGLKNNKRVGEYKDPLNVFMGTLRKGIAWVEPNYVSPQETALRERLEAKKREQERVAVLQRELFNTEFEAWVLTLSEEEKHKIAPDRIQSFANAKLRTHFAEIVWPAIKANG